MHKRSVRILTIALLSMQLAGCSVPGAVRPGEVFSTRDLAPEEKQALGSIVAETLKDPESARFKWMPVALRERNGITDYCGLLNGKNSYGGYTGYTRFYGHLTKDAAGRFIKINVRAIEEPNREANLIDSRWLNGICESYGYVDFSLAR